MHNLTRIVNRSLLIIITIVFVLIISILLTVLVFIVMEHLGLLAHIKFTGMTKELFSRIFLVWVLLFFFGPLLFSKALRDRVRTERWILIMVVLFALGSLSALGDPLHYISREGNWIRYWTAGVLGAAGAISVASSLRSAHQPIDRLFGASFGLLLIAAGGDELFEFHEYVGHRYEAFLPSTAGTSGQDLLTLGVAGLGAVAVVMVVLVWRFLPRTMDLISEQRYQRAFSFFVLAVLTFASAMMLDSFDWVLEGFADQLRTMISGPSGSNEVPRWLGVNNITRAANSLEELLEYLAALFFLMMIGTLFSVKALVSRA